MYLTDDPIRDQLRYDAEQEAIRIKRKYLTCECCDGKIYKTDEYADGDYYYDFDGTIICEECINDYLRERKVQA